MSHIRTQKQQAPKQHCSHLPVLESLPMSAARAFYFAYFWFPESGGRVARA